MKVFMLLAGAAAANAESILYDPKTHVAMASAGCTGGPSSKYPTGATTPATISVGGQTWSYQVTVPTGYDGSTPTPLIVQHPGWGYNAAAEASGCGIDLYASTKGFISVTVTGGNDNPNSGGPWYSWNVAGTTLSPGTDGPTCTSAGSIKKYCYTSCAAANKCPSPFQCSWTTCYDTGPTASGTGTGPIAGFVPTLYNTLETQLCVDTTREFVAGESNGGMSTYQEGASNSLRFAAAAPQFGSYHRGFAMAPLDDLPLLDIHGSQDTTIPANVSLSGDGYYYTTTAEIFALWEPMNGGNGTYSQYVTAWDGQMNAYCIQSSNGKTVRCMWNGGHNWFLNSATANGGLVTGFLLQWANPTHVGGGNVLGEPYVQPQVGEVTILSAEQYEAMQAADIAATLSTDLFMDIVPEAKAHYGNPKSVRGCLPDEDALQVGENGMVCAPKVNSTLKSTECKADKDCLSLGKGSYCMIDPHKTAPYYCFGKDLPVPKCVLGDFANEAPGCPTDGAVRNGSKAWPVCMGKGVQSIPYVDNDFHCLLTCPYSSPDKDTHCPTGALCQRGELRHTPHGVCAYPKKK